MKMLRAATLIAISALITNIPAACSGESGKFEWNQWRGANRDGISTETGWSVAWPKEGPKKLWTASVGIGYSSVAVSNGKVYTMGYLKEDAAEKEHVWCINADTGAVVWKFSFPSLLDAVGYTGGTNSTPAVDGNFVYAMSKRGHAWCFDAGTGKIVWEANLSGEDLSQPPKATMYGGISSSPLICGDKVVFYNSALEKKPAKSCGKLPRRRAGPARSRTT